MNLTGGSLVQRTTPVHVLPAHCKLVAVLAFVTVVAFTPREEMVALAVFGVLIAATAAIARVTPIFLLRRLWIEIPFLAFLVLLPFVGSGDTTNVFGLSVSTEGLWTAWNVFAKATLGFSALIILAATTPVSEMLHGLQVLRAPRVLVAIAGFMVRYADVVGDEMRRMRIARISRAHDPRWFWQARALASGLGTLFIRSFERGERVHSAMLSRGFTGSIPTTSPRAAASSLQWMLSLALPLVAAAAVMVVSM